MSTKKKHLKINVYSFLAHVYFFFNKVGLPFGLQYTHILAPFFYFSGIRTKRKFYLGFFLTTLFIFDIIHLINGVEGQSFFISNILYILTYITALSIYHFINNYSKLETIYRQLLINNFLFTLVAIIVFFTPYRPVLWYINKFTEGVTDFPRLALLTYEASYYSTLLVPVVFYYLLKIFTGKNEAPVFPLLVVVLLPLILSLSVGVIGGMVFTGIIFFMIHWKKIFYKRNFFISYLSLLFIFSAACIILFVFLPDNPLSIRIHNIFKGYDTSSTGRTIDSFTMAYRIASLKSVCWGIGAGQIKILASDVVRIFYNYWGEVGLIRIPNAVAETLAVFGIFGIMIRFGLIFYLFFKTKVLANYYRSCLFIFIFIYQFTGSYITNIAEYVIWVLAFSNVFKEFDVKKAAA